MRAVVVGAVAAMVLMAGCTTVVSGSGTGAGHPSKATPSHPFASSTPPKSSHPTTPSQGPSHGISAALRRTPLSTSLGDPVRIDFCSVQSRQTRIGGTTVSPYAIQRLAGCDYQAVAGSGQTFDLNIEALPRADFVARRGSTSARRSGLRVVADPFAGNACARTVIDGRLAVQVFSVKTGAVPAHRRAVYCGAVDRLTAKVAGRLAHKSLHRLRMAAPTITALDMCRTLDPHTAASLIGRPSVRTYAVRFGTGCEWQTSSAYLYATVRIDGLTRDRSLPTLTIGGHPMRTSRASDPTSYCEVVSEQGHIGRVATSGGDELIEMLAETTRPNPGRSMCTAAEHGLARILGAAGLS